MFNVSNLKQLVKKIPSYYISGELGDIIYSLPAIKSKGGGNLFIGGQFKEFPNFKELTPYIVYQLSQIIEQEDYIYSVKFATECPYNAINLNYFKNDFKKWTNNELNDEEVDVVRTTKLTTWFSKLLEVEDTYHCNWLTNNFESEEYICINRTAKYHNDNFPWKEVVKNYSDKIVFVGLPDEYNDFVRNFGYVKFHETKSILELFEIICKCKVFIGNQSFAYSLAESIKKPCIQETDRWICNCKFERDSALFYEGHNIYHDISEFLSRYSFYGKEGSDVTVLRKNSKRILYLGQSGTCGYAKASKSYIYDFYKKGFDIEWFPLRFDTSIESKTDLDLIVKGLTNEDPNGEYDEMYIHCTPDLWQPFKERFYDHISKSKVYGYSVWEAEKLPPDWVEHINSNVDVLQVPSKYNQDIYKNNGITVPIEIKPHIFNYEKCPNKKDVTIRCINGNILDNDKFTFYNISELNERKGIIDALDCFVDCFANNPSVQFLLKLHYKDYCAENTEYIIKKLDKYLQYKNIFIVVQNLDQKELLAFHTVGDCYLSLHKGEAFGLVIHEAYNYGKTIITNRYGGQVDFLGEDYPYLTDYEMVNVTNMEEFSCWYSCDQQWGKPNLQQAKQFMLKVYNENR